MILEQIRQMKENHSCSRAELDELVDKMEELIGEAAMWRNIRPALTFDELLENAEFIAREEDL